MVVVGKEIADWNVSRSRVARSVAAALGSNNTFDLAVYKPSSGRRPSSKKLLICKAVLLMRAADTRMAGSLLEQHLWNPQHPKAQSNEYA